MVTRTSLATATAAHISLGPTAAHSSCNSSNSSNSNCNSSRQQLQHQQQQLQQEALEKTIAWGRPLKIIYLGFGGGGRVGGASPFSTKLAVAEKHEPLCRSARTPSLLRRPLGQSARACRSELLRPALGSRRSGRTCDKWRARLGF